MTVSISTQQDGGAFIFMAARSGHTSAVAIRNCLMSETSRFANTMSAVYSSLERFGAEALPQTERLQPGALTDELRTLAARMVAPSYRTLRDDIQQASRDDAARTARINEPPTQLPFASEDRAEFRALAVGEQASWILAADRTQLSALIVAGRARFSGVSDDLWNEIVDRHAILAHIEKTGLQADFQLQPTPSHPAAIGPDIEAAEAAARAVVQRRHTDQQDIRDAEAVLRSVIIAIAVTTDLAVEDAFKLLNEAA